MKRMMLLPLSGLLLLVGCGGHTNVNGYSLNSRTWERDRQAILSRASYDLRCPADQLELTVLGIMNNHFAQQVGVRGCGNDAVYVDPIGNSMWIQNGSTAR